MSWVVLKRTNGFNSTFRLVCSDHLLEKAGLWCCIVLKYCGGGLAWWCTKAGNGAKFQILLNINFGLPFWCCYSIRSKLHAWMHCLLVVLKNIYKHKHIFNLIFNSILLLFLLLKSVKSVSDCKYILKYHLFFKLQDSSVKQSLCWYLYPE